MKICPLMSNSESSVNCTPDCNWFDHQKNGCIVFSMKSLLDDIKAETVGIEDYVEWIESNIPRSRG